MKYKGYTAKIKFSEADRVFVGQVVGIRDVISFEGGSVDELNAAFEQSIDDYLAFCQETQRQPGKSYSGRFVLRLSPVLHAKAEADAVESGCRSLNEYVVGLIAGEKGTG